MALWASILAAGVATALVALVAALVGPAIAYVAAARRLSGKIATSDASDLWEESRSIRDDYRNRLGDANRRIGELEARVSELEATELSLLAENRDLRAQVGRLEAIVEEKGLTDG